MPATANIGQLINSSNTGYAANVSTSAFGPHSPRTLTTHSGNFTTTSNGQVVEGLNITGLLTIKHDNVIVRDCKIQDIENGDNRTHTGMQILWCVIGPDKGQTGSGRGSTVRFMKNFLIYRCQIRARIDLVHPWGGTGQIVENLFKSPLYDTTGVSNHMDPIQPPGDNPARWTSLLVQGNHFDIWPIRNGEDVGSRDGDFSVKSATSGVLNCEFNCNNTTIRDNYSDGNYAQCIYIINGDNNTSDGKPKHSGNVQFGPPTNTVIIDNIFKSRRGPDSDPSIKTNNRYGESRFMNFGGVSGAAYPTVVWGRNYDADSGDTLAAFFTTYKTGTNHEWSNVVNAGPSSQYPTFYTSTPLPPDDGGGSGGGQNPVVAMKVTTPANGSVNTSGSVVFVGGADTAAGDSDTNYNYYNYYIQSVTPGVLGKTHLDRDSVTNNNGFTFTPTSSGVIFVDRSGTTRNVPPGEYKLIIEGERKDGTRPSGEITVTFGTIEAPPPPPTNIQFEPKIPAIIEGRIKVNTSIGGVPRNLVQTVRRRVPASWREETYLRRKDTKTEVVDLGDIIVDKVDL